MKNLAYLLCFLWLSAAIISCEKDMAEPAAGSDSTAPPPAHLAELITDQESLLQALSRWIASPEAKQWFMDRANQNSRNRGPVLDETLLLEVACGSEGEHFVDIYNTVTGAAHSTSTFSNFIQSENPMLALKFDAYFDDFIDQMNRYTPLMSDQHRSVTYLEGEPYDVAPALTETGGAIIIDFRLTEAANRVLFDPATNSFNQGLPYPFCSDRLFLDRLQELPDPVCNGQIPLSITEHVQAIFYEACGGGIDVNFGGGGDEICDNGIDDDNDGLVDCEDPDCCGFEGCDSCVETDCTNGIDDDGDGLIDEEDPDCFNDSPCMRDHYMDNNFFAEMELVRPHVLAEMGANLCNGTITMEPYTHYTNVVSYGISMYPDHFGDNSELEEWYNFLVKIHWGTPSGSDGIFQELVYTVHLFELANEPDFHLTYYSGGGGGVAVLVVDQQGLTETLPVPMGMIPFYAASDVCGQNNWDPSVFGDLVAISIHEGDPCLFRTTSGEVETTSIQRSYSSGFTMRLGAGIRTGQANASGGFLYSRRNNYATSDFNQINNQYVTNYADDFYLGRINYSYCWEDQGTTDQLHEITFGNTMNLRLLSQICE